MPAATSTSELRHLEDPTEGLSSIAAWLGFTDASSLEDTYPSVYRFPDAVTRIGSFMNDRLVSHVAARDVRMCTSAGTVPATLIGSVATAPEARGQGLASKLMHQAIAEASARGSHACLLWSDAWTFYERLGFVGAGTQWELPLPPASVVGGPGEARAAAIFDLPAMWTLHQQKPLRIERSLGEMTLLMSTRRLQAFVLEQDHQVVAYACVGKGDDLQGWWHEFGGDDEAVLHLLALLRRPGNEIVMVPPYRTTLRDHLATRQSGPTAGVCALIRPLRGGLGEFFVDGLDSV